MQVMKQIEIKNQGDRITFHWNWCVGNEVVVKVYVMRAEEAVDWSTEYGEELCEVRKIPSYALARKEVTIGNLASGKYQVTFVPYIRDEILTEGIVFYDSVYLGKPRELFFHVERGSGKEKGMAVIQIAFSGKEIPEGHLCIHYLPFNMIYPILFPISSGERILMIAEPERVLVKAASGYEDCYFIHQ